MTTDPSIDIRFLSELVRRADLAGNDRIAGTEICEAIAIPRAEADIVVRRLRNRGLVEETPARKRMSDTAGDADIRPTAEAYRSVGRGVIG